MKNLKIKILSITMIVAMFALTACGGKNESKESNDTKPSQTTSNTTSEMTKNTEQDNATKINTLDDTKAVEQMIYSAMKTANVKGFAGVQLTTEALYIGYNGDVEPVKSAMEKLVKENEALKSVAIRYNYMPISVNDLEEVKAKLEQVQFKGKVQPIIAYDKFLFLDVRYSDEADKSVVENKLKEIATKDVKNYIMVLSKDKDLAWTEMTSGDKDVHLEMEASFVSIANTNMILLVNHSANPIYTKANDQIVELKQDELAVVAYANIKDGSLPKETITVKYGLSKDKADSKQVTWKLK